MNDRLLAIGDIHGCFDALKDLIEHKIILTKSDKIILLGDYIDRGNQSKEVVDFIINLQKEGFDIVPLMGNHEAMLIDAFGNEKLVSKWLQNGASQTLKSFGINSVNDLDQSYLNFFKDLRYYLLYKEYLFVHAGFNDDISNPFEDKYSMIWICREIYLNSALSDKTIVHAHSPITVSICKEKIRNNTNVINLDTGCVYSDKDGYGRLTAIELNTKGLYFA